jgi:hypothetical protein
MSDQNLEHPSSHEPDLRYFPRWEVKNRVLYRIEKDDEIHEGTTKDISCAGACIIGDAKITLHQKIKLTVQLSEGITIKLNGRILWVKSDIDQPEMGVSFYDTPDEIQDSILQHAFELDKGRVLKQWYKGWNDS